ncbi:MAG TPA: hypothetical protein VGT06_01360 [Candidatus Methylomirabilis sp.]|nr:hypothetical protein [Candidatus Methylomirabilis sp.]
MLMHPAKPPDLDDVERQLTLLALGLRALTNADEGQPEPEELGALWLLALEARNTVRLLLTPGQDIEKPNGGKT